MAEEKIKDEEILEEIIPGEEIPEDPTEDLIEETPTEETPGEETPGEETKAPVEEEPPAEFKFDEPEESDLTEIVHNGKTHKVTHEQLINLAQKGFDYDFKVGPHGKIVQMLDADPELQEIITEHWNKKTGQGSGPEIKPFADYEDTDEWLRDNLSNISSQPQPPQFDIGAAMRMRDPDSFDTVIQHLEVEAKKLSVRDYERIETDLGALCKFYDYVKAKVVPAPSSTPTPNFRVKPSGGEPPKKKIKNPWEMPKDEFQKQLDRAKGYA